MTDQGSLAKRGRGRPPRGSADLMPENRDFECQVCGKTYLSNPALYLHMKIKHSAPQQQLCPSSSTAGEKKARGRPRKIVSIKIQQCVSFQYSGADGYLNTGFAPGRIDPTNEQYFKTEDKAGGPTDPLTGFEQCTKIMYDQDLSKKSYSEDSTLHPMYEYLSRYSHKVTPMGGAVDEPIQDKSLIKSVMDVRKEIVNLAENKKNMMNCDQIFALYLREMAQIVNTEFYSKKFLKFIMLFRDCLNIYGWHKKAENEVKDFFGKSEYDAKLNEKVQSYSSLRSQAEFTVVNNAEFAPEIANEFVTVFFDENIAGQLTRTDVIDFTQHLCHWLFSQKLTCSKLSMVSGS